MLTSQPDRRTRFLIQLGLVILLPLFSACRPAETEATRESGSRRYYLTQWLDCSLVTTVKRGQTWYGLTVGKSTEADVRAKLEPLADLDWSALGRFTFTRRRTTIGGWDSVEACFVNDRLAILKINGESQYDDMTLDDWVEQYSRPDRVTWSTDYYCRSVIWADDGVLVEICHVYFKYTGGVILFSPIPPKKLETSWLLAGLPSELHGSAGDVAGAPPPVEDPWGIVGEKEHGGGPLSGQ